MDRRWVIVAAGLLLAVFALIPLAMLGGGEADPAQTEEPGAEKTGQQTDASETEMEGRRRAIAETREERTGGVEHEHPRRSAIPPKDAQDKAEDWQQVRAAQFDELHSSQTEATAEFTASLGLSQEETDVVVDAVDRLFAEIDRMRAQVESGELSPADHRVRMRQLREVASAEISAIMGPGNTKALRAHLGQTTGGGF